MARCISCALGLLAVVASPALAQNDARDLAKQLSNPIAALISVPLQLNYDENIGPDGDGTRLTLNVQPVIPFSLNENWNVISRTILPIVSTDGLLPGEDRETGLGDTVQSLFFSPKTPTASGWIWGAGPVLVLPTASDDQFGLQQWGAGPTAVALRQQGAWTYGGLANHVWDINGDTEVDQTFLQPFISYTTPDAWTFTLNSESTYDWEDAQWSVPVNAIVSKVVQIGGLPVSFAGGLRYWAESPEFGPEDWGARFAVTYLFPR